MIYDYKTISNICVCGDIHGEFKEFFNKVIQDTIVDDVHPLVAAEQEKNTHKPQRRRGGLALFGGLEYSPLRKLSKTDGEISISDRLIIVAGDCGFGFNKPNYYLALMERANKKLAEHNVHIIFVRGNHDDPSYFDDNTINYSNIKAVSDYSVIQTQTHNILCIGGAISVDRTWRKQQEAIINKYKTRKKSLYWENEAFPLNLDILTEYHEMGIEINGVVTHSSPQSFYPKDKKMPLSWFRVDPHLKEDIHAERNNLEQVYQKLLELECNLDFWLYGHFHEENYEMKKNSSHYMLVYALDHTMRIIDPIHHRKLFIDLEASKKEKKKRKKDGSSINWDCVFSPFVTAPSIVASDLASDFASELASGGEEDAI